MSKRHPPVSVISPWNARAPLGAAVVSLALLAGALSLTGTSDRALARDRNDGGTAGVPWTGAPAVVESVGAIMSRQAQADAAGGPGASYAGSPVGGGTERVSAPPAPKVASHDHRAQGQERHESSDELDVGQWPPPDVGTTRPSTGVLAPQTLGTSFTGVTLADSGYIPPDSMGAVGPTQVLFCENGRIRVFSKAGVIGALDVTTDTFFNSVRSAVTSDPRVIYDRLSQRWFVAMIDVASTNRVLIAVSSGPTITGQSSFSFFQFQHDLVGTTPNSDTNGFADYESLGVDKNALYIGVNIFNASGTAFLGSTGFVTGSVTFMDGTTTLGTGTIGSGQATYTTPALTAGSHSITAVYGGDTSFLTSTSSALGETVNPASTSTTLASSANPSSFGQTVVFTATVAVSAPGSGGPTGTITFYDNGSSLGTGTVTGGQATYSTSSLALGTHPITAVYGGDSNFTGSTSSPALSQAVRSATTTTVGSSLTPSTYGQPVVFTATVTGSGGTLTGSVTFLDGTTTLGTGTIISGQATYTTSALAAGSHSITASYGGDSNFGSSTSSPALVQTVNQAASATTVSSSSPNPSTFGQSVTFLATVSGSGATGAVTFEDGTATLGTVTVSGGGASFTTSSLSAGAHSIRAIYSGDSNFLGSTSAVLTQTVNPGTTSTTLGSSPNPSLSGQSVLFTATVSVTSGSGTLAGTVGFYDGSTLLGSSGLTGNTATYSTSSLAGGSRSITAVYGADPSFAGSTSAVLTQTVKFTTTTSVTSSPNPSTFGHAVQFTATVSGSGATGAVTFKDGTATLGTGTLGGGVATFTTTSSLAPGTHSITAVYGGDASFAGSTSGALSQVVSSGTIVFSSGEVDIPIPDVSTITSTITIGPGITIKDVDVKLNINHTYDSDLVITLASPSGQKVQLVNRRGGSGHNFTSTTLNDDAATAIRNGRAPFTGSFRPEQSLTVYDGKSATGTWTLTGGDFYRAPFPDESRRRANGTVDVDGFPNRASP